MHSVNEYIVICIIGSFYQTECVFHVWSHCISHSDRIELLIWLLIEVGIFSHLTIRFQNDSWSTFPPLFIH